MTLIQKALQALGKGAASGSRGQSRLARVALSAGSQLVAKGLTFILMLASLRWTGYLNDERMGTWILITSLITGLTWVDLGIGNALITHLARAAAREDREECTRLFSSAVFLLSGVALIGLAVLVTLTLTVDLRWVLALKPSAAGEMAEARRMVLVGVVLFCATVPTSLIERARLSFQESHITSWFLASSGLLSLMLLAVASSRHATLPVLLATLLVPPLFAAVLNGWHLLRKQRPWLLPELSAFRRSYGILMLQTGAVFLGLNLLQVANYQLDNLIIAHLHGQPAVKQYTFHQRPFQIIQSIQLLCVVPLWPAYAEAIARGEIAWVRRLLYSSLGISLVFGIVSASVLLPTGPWLIPLWVGKPVTVSMPLLWSLASWNILAALGATVAVFWNSLSLLRLQLVLSLVLAVVSVPAKWWLGKRFGLTGVVWATTTSYMIVVVIPCLFLVPRQLAGVARRVQVTV